MVNRKETLETRIYTAPIDSNIFYETLDLLSCLIVLYLLMAHKSLLYNKS
jgi:hypothetical protein